METSLFNVIPDSSQITAHPPDLSAEDEALDLRLHYTGLAHFFAAFEPRRQDSAPSRFPETRQRESSPLSAATAD